MQNSSLKRKTKFEMNRKSKLLSYSIPLKHLFLQIYISDLNPKLKHLCSRIIAKFYIALQRGMC